MLQKMRYFLLIIVSSLGLLLWGCRERTSHNSNIMTPSVEFVDERSYTPFADAITSVELIPIETDDQHLLGDNVYLYLSPNGFLLADKQNAKLNRYSIDGKFLNTVGRRGNGPGEYRGISDIQVLGDQIHVYDDPERELVFSLDGELLENNKQDLGFHSFRTSSGILSYYGYGAKKGYRVIYQREKDGKEFGFLESDSKLLALTLDNDVFAPSADGGVVFVDSYSPTIYKFYNEEVTPYLSFNLGRYSIKESFFTAGDAFLAAEELFASNYGIIIGYSESNEYKIVQLMLKDQSKDRSRLEYGLYNGKKWLWFSFSDLVEESMTGSLCFLCDGILYGLFTIEELNCMKDLFRQKIINNELNSIAEDDDGYVLAKIRIK